MSNQNWRRAMAFNRIRATIDNVVPDNPCSQIPGDCALLKSTIVTKAERDRGITVTQPNEQLEVVAVKPSKAGLTSICLTNRYSWKVSSMNRSRQDNSTEDRGVQVPVTWRRSDRRTAPKGNPRCANWGSRSAGSGREAVSDFGKSD